MIIYCATNIKNSKKYIGMTKKSLDERIENHYNSAFKKNNKTLFYKALRKYGKENFIWDILFEDNNLTYKELGEKEKEYIKKFETLIKGYNMIIGGNGGDILTNNPNREEIIKKRSKTVTGKKYKPMSKETKESRNIKISLKIKGKRNFKIKGEKHWTCKQGKQVAKQKISQGMLNSQKWQEIIHSEQYSIKMSNSLKNSEKHKKALKDPKRGKKISEATTYIPTLEQINKVIFMYEKEKYSIKQIERILIFSSHYIRKILLSNNIKIERTRRKKIVNKEEI
jgi:group I intron endonuclease